MGCQGKAVIKSAPTWCWSSVRSSSAVMSPEPEPAACWERSVKTHKGRQRRHAENGTGNTQEKAVKTHKGGQRKTQGKEAKRQGRAGPHTREGRGNAQGRAVETHTHVETHKERQRRHRERHAEVDDKCCPTRADEVFSHRRVGDGDHVGQLRGHAPRAERSRGKEMTCS